MRKQYHIRDSEQGLLAWDVDRLVSLTKHLPVDEVSLASLAELDEPYWSDQPLSVRQIAEHARLIQDCQISYPIILDHKGRVMDGMHGVARAWLEGRATISAVRLNRPVEPDFIGVPADRLPYD